MIKIKMADPTKMIKLLLKLQNNIRLFHWNTLVYKNHIASDKLYDAIDTHVDRFVEVYMAKHGRIGTASKVIQVNTNVLTDAQIVPYLKKVVAFLSNETFYSGFSSDPDLQTILSDMIEALNTAIYLMVMKT